MRLYHVREHPRTGSLDARDEEECFTVAGRKVGVWLTTEVPRNPNDPGAFTADVDIEVLESYEVTSDEATHREFVVPGDVVSGLGFACPTTA